LQCVDLDAAAAVAADAAATGAAAANGAADGFGNTSLIICIPASAIPAGAELYRV